MNRRQFLTSTLAASLAAPALGASEQVLFSSDWKVFQITTNVTLPDVAGPAELWLPLAQTAGGYQNAKAAGPSGGIALLWDEESQAEVVYDARYGAPIMHKVWKEGDVSPRQFKLRQRVAVQDRHGVSFLLPLTEVERKFWTAPTANMPLDGIILATAVRITARKKAPEERLRAIYDWVVDHTHRDPDVPGCGRGDAKRMLESGQMGGKCADINGLMVALARAAGFPAREVYGLRVAPSRNYPSLGASGDVSKAQHCRVEVFLDGEGWFPLDPADMVKILAVEKVAPDSAEARLFRDYHFGSWEMNWVGYNSATDIELPGSDGNTRKPEFPFLMYPCAVTSDGECPCLDPAKFRYEITTREITT